MDYTIDHCGYNYMLYEKPEHYHEDIVLQICVKKHCGIFIHEVPYQSHTLEWKEAKLIFTHNISRLPDTPACNTLVNYCTMVNN